MKTGLKKQKTGSVIGADALRAISAVEGIRLTPESALRLRKLKSGGLTPEQRRAQVIAAYAQKTPRKSSAE
jgi:hypothetical protein